MTIVPDIKFIESLKKQSNAPLKQCMQCGNCSVVCELSTEDNPFPRKEMMWAAWGQKDKLMCDPNIWLCHQCGDCTTYCPRGVKPGDVLAALRQNCILFYARPKLLGKLLGNPWFLPFALIIPLAIILFILWIAVTIEIPQGAVNYSKLFPHLYLNTTFGLLVLAIIIGVIYSVRAFRSNIKVHSEELSHKMIGIKNLLRSVKEILTHEKFRMCQANKSNYYAHLMVLWGFIILLAVTVYAIFSVLFSTYPIPLLHPVKIVANIASLLLFIGTTIMIYKRLFNKEKPGYSNYFDWVFLISFYFLITSGIFVETARFADWQAGYYIYLFHLALVWFVIIFAPYTKFAHFIYRTLALTYLNKKEKIKE